VPFLTFAPDARGAGAGDVGAATRPDANSGHWNPAKFAFVDERFGVSVSYSPWLRQITPDMSLSYLSAFKRIGRNEVVAASVRYFDLGSVQVTNNTGQLMQNLNPREMAIDGTYSRQLGRRFSIAGTVRFVHSNLAGQTAPNSPNLNLNAGPGNTVAVDVAWYYVHQGRQGLRPLDFALGMHIANVGGKISYGGTGQAEFLPASLRLGTALTRHLDPSNQLTLAFDVSKLLAPTPAGDDPHAAAQQLTVLRGVLGSFADAPGGWREEIRELMYALGLEYWYKDMLAFRGGYYNEHRTKGGRKYMTLGLGLRYQAFGLDFAYLLPQAQTLPLGDTMRFSLLFGFDRRTASFAQEVVARR
jgi:hypothetical protein